MALKILLIALAGALGTLARYGVSGVVQRAFNSGGVAAGFPTGTLAVNIIGCFLFGVIWTLSEERFLLSPQTRLIFLTGFMGAFTTFSTFGFESAQFIRDAQYSLAALNIIAQNVTGILAVFAGLIAARLI